MSSLISSQVSLSINYLHSGLRMSTTVNPNYIHAFPLMRWEVMGWGGVAVEMWWTTVNPNYLLSSPRMSYPHSYVCLHYWVLIYIIQNLQTVLIFKCPLTTHFPKLGNDVFIIVGCLINGNKWFSTFFNIKISIPRKCFPRLQLRHCN